MVSRVYNGGSSAVKWIVLGILTLLAGLTVLVVLASRAYSPQEIAQAQQIMGQTAINRQKAAIDLQYYGPVKAADYQAYLASLAEQDRLQHQLDDQKVAQAAQDYALTAQLKWLLGIGSVAALIILALGATSYALSRAWAIAVRTQLERRMAHQSATNVQRLGVLYQILTENHAAVIQMQLDVDRTLSQFQQLSSTVKKLEDERRGTEDRGQGMGDAERIIDDEGRTTNVLRPPSFVRRPRSAVSGLLK